MDNIYVFSGTQARHIFRGTDWWREIPSISWHSAPISLEFLGSTQSWQPYPGLLRTPQALTKHKLCRAPHSQFGRDGFIWNHIFQMFRPKQQMLNVHLYENSGGWSFIMFLKPKEDLNTTQLRVQLSWTVSVFPRCSYWLQSAPVSFKAVINRGKILPRASLKPMEQECSLLLSVEQASSVSVPTTFPCK